MLALVNYMCGSGVHLRTLSSKHSNQSIHPPLGTDNSCIPVLRRQRNHHRQVLALGNYMCGSDFRLRTLPSNRPNWSIHLLLGKDQYRMTV